MNNKHTKLLCICLALALALSLGLTGYLFLGPVEAPVARSSADYVWLREETVNLTATGAAGSGTGSATTSRELHGYIYAVHVDAATGISITTDITLSQSSPAGTILAVSDTMTDSWYYPVVQQTTSAGAGSSTYEKAIAEGIITVSTAETVSGTVGTITIWWGP